MYFVDAEMRYNHKSTWTTVAQEVSKQLGSNNYLILSGRSGSAGKNRRALTKPWAEYHECVVFLLVACVLAYALRVVVHTPLSLPFTLLAYPRASCWLRNKVSSLPPIRVLHAFFTHSPCAIFFTWLNAFNTKLVRIKGFVSTESEISLFLLIKAMRSSGYRSTVEF